MRFLLVIISLMFLTACNDGKENKPKMPKEYNQTFVGDSNNVYRYKADEKLTIEYKGNIIDIGKEVSFTYHSVLNNGTTTEKAEDFFPEKTFSSIGTNEGIIDGDSGEDFIPINVKDSEIEVTVKWKNKSEKIQLNSIDGE